MSLRQKISVRSKAIMHPIIDAITLYKFTNNQEYLFIPEGCFELIFELNGATQQKFLTSSYWEKRPNYFVGGLHNESYIVKPEIKNQYSIGVKLKPDMAHAFMQGDKNLNSFKNQIVDIREFSNSTVKKLIENIHKQQSFDKICYHIVDFFNKFYSSPNHYNLIISASEIIKKNGRINISKLSKNANLSESHYRKLFRETIGLSPREYSKIIRIKSAIRYLEVNNENSLTKTAIDLGYFDQSHFVREFKSVVNLTPSEFLA